MTMITAIIPLRLATEPLYDEIERLHRICRSIPSDEFRILIVDYGTHHSRVSELADFPTRYDNVQVARTGDPSDPFSIGAARDYGVQMAETPVVMFHDLDFLCETETYRDISSEVRLRNLDKRGYSYLCVPTIYLTAQGSEIYLSKHNASARRDADRFVHSQAIIANKTEFVEHYAIGSSATIVNRYFYLVSGGHDRSFVGHGAEDFEFYNRLSDLAPKAARPPLYNENISFASGRWEGFRAFFALYGMELWMRGVSFVHLHHPRREDFDPSYRKSADNFHLLKKKIGDFSKNKVHLRPLEDSRLKTRTLMLVEPNTMPATALRGALPAMGDFELLSEKVFSTPDLLVSYVEEEDYDRVLFLNPYGNPHRLELFEAVRAARIPFLTFDRGALPDSWFFDDGGFLGNSSRYDAENWDKPIPMNALEDTRRWMKEYSSSGITLEANSPRKTSAYWKDKFGLGPRKMIFVALQRPSDTATRFFSGPAGSYSKYIEWIDNLARRIDKRKYLLVVKKHPLEDDCPRFDGAVLAPGDANIHDLIEASDVVVVLNSGTGVIALAMDRPVVVCGNAYYAGSGLAGQAKSEDELLEKVISPTPPDKEKAAKFLHYLRNEFYSYGNSHYVDLKNEAGDNIKIVDKIDFSVLRGLPFGEVELGSVPGGIPLDAFMMRGGKGFQPVPSPTPKNDTPTSDFKQAKISAPRREAFPINLMSRLMLKASGSRRSGDKIQIRGGERGYAVHGPYIELKPGSYRAEIIIAHGQSVGKMFTKKRDVVFDVAIGGGQEVLCVKKIHPRALPKTNIVTLPFKIDETASIAKAEVRIWTDGKVDFEVSSVFLKEDLH